MKLVVLLSLFFITSCDFLTTRNAENPDLRRSSFIDATTPEQLFSNLKDSFREKIERNYESCFVDSSFLNKGFIFYPSSEAMAKYSVLSEWDIDAEKDYFKNLIANIPIEKSVIVTLTEVGISPQGDSALYSYNYTIYLPNISDQVEVEYRGSSQFKINLDANNQWVITEWIDISSDEYPSWSELKGRFY